MPTTPRFEWDDAKNAENRRKHGIGFEEAAEIFNRSVLTRADDRHHGEVREIGFGFLDNGVVAAVAHTDRDGVIRTISARKATERERNLFHAYLERTLG